MKYHSFVRSLSGAFVTVEDQPKISLTKTNQIGELKAFELGNCKYCRSQYIIGKIWEPREDGLSYLLQNEEIDLYENYGDNENIQLDFFVMDGAVDEEFKTDDYVERCVLCNSCGCIMPHLNSPECDCSSEHKLIIWRVKHQKDEDSYNSFNNIHRCVCCGRKNVKGIVKALNTGKDEGTAIIAQTLYEALSDDEAYYEQPKKKLTLSKTGSEEVVKTEKQEPDIKQFLEFSDSRQQASFAAVFFESNHTRMLRKRLIWEVIKEKGYKDIPVETLKGSISDLIKKNNLFDNKMSDEKNAWLAVLVDLLKVDGVNDGEGLGLYHFDLDVNDMLSDFSDDDVSSALSEYGIKEFKKSELCTLLQVVLETFKTTPAINYSSAALSPEERTDNLGYRRFDNSIILQKPEKSKDKSVSSFLPVLGNENSITRYVVKACGCDYENAIELLQMLFRICIDGELFERTSKPEHYQIRAEKYVLKNHKTTQYYQCKKCGRITPHNIRNNCVQNGCDGTLVPVDTDEVLASNYYRKQYKNKEIERIVIQEHTAQINKEDGKKFQQEFKDKKINILSCSTTFEMGIDIGALETVLMRNVPPSPANYVQRAGRAGRRKDSAAFILTYCGTASHDYTYFCEPERMISGFVNPPFFDVDNNKIIVRHLMAASLGFFFKQYTDYFDSIDALVFSDGLEKFESYIESRPKDLNDYINAVIPEKRYDSYRNFKWYNNYGGRDERLALFASAIKDNVRELEEACVRARDEEKYREADYFKNQISKIKDGNVISELSKYCVIPKYGFPVDTVELVVYDDEGKLDDSYNLSRDLRLAISEYAPDSELIANKNKLTSKYITLPHKTEFRKNYFSQCPNVDCAKINVAFDSGSLRTCSCCGEDLTTQVKEYFIEPKYGFKTGKTKESVQKKPERSYAGEVSFLSSNTESSESVSVGSMLSVTTASNANLLVKNKSKFYYCPVCGYGEKIKKYTDTPIAKFPHKNFRKWDCKNDQLELIHLGHVFQTDIARFSVTALSCSETRARSKALSFMYAFIEGISIALDIDRNDINGILELNTNTNSYDIIIYDDVPGGAGHCKRLANEKAIKSALREAHKKVSQNCCDENTSCYNCLRDYKNQNYHNKLRRIYAKNLVEEIIQDLEGAGE